MKKEERGGGVKGGARGNDVVSAQPRPKEKQNNKNERNKKKRNKK